MNPQNTTFRGFLVIAHLPGQNNSVIGTFTPQNANQQTLNCDLAMANALGTVGHSNAAPNTVDFTSQEMIWQAPADSNGTVDFR